MTITAVSHAPLGKISAHLAELHCRGVDLDVSEDDGMLLISRRPANLDMGRVKQFLRVCPREIHGVLAAGGDQMTMGRLESVRWAREHGRYSD